MTSVCAPAPLARAIAVKHIGFCGRLAAGWRRDAPARPGVQRVFALVSSATHIHSSFYAPLYATVTMPASRLELALAPSIRIELHSPTTLTALAPPRPVVVERPASGVHTTPPLRCATTVLKTPQPTPQSSAARPAVAEVAPVLRQVVERRHRDEVSVMTHAIATVRRSELQRLETIVRRPAAAVAAPSAEPTPASRPHVEPRAGNHGPSRPPTISAPASIPDAEVARLTERVVQQINRRILAERERRGA